MVSPINESSAICTYYSNQHILITGVTGFMGKILLEKLLRSCPDFGAIYILIRPKKGVEPSLRLEALLKSPIFDGLRRATDGSVQGQDRIHCMAGDVSKSNLNLSNDDLQTLLTNVRIVFHMAANVRFDQTLKNAVELNTGGTLNLLELSLGFERLQAFIYVSTSYCHCDRVELEEKVYKAPQAPRNILNLTDWMGEDLLEVLTPVLLKNSPNTYAYTKCLTEQLVCEYAEKLPVAIARPSIVSAAWKEPIPGWVDNMNGATGLLVGAGKGVIRTMYCDADLEADIVAVDSSINALLIIGWQVGTRPKQAEPEVFHITSNKDYPITWGRALDIGNKYVLENPFSLCLWYPGGSLKSNYYVHLIALFLFHTVPAYLVDFLMLITGNKPFLVQIQKRITNGLQVLQYYTVRPWYFHNQKLKQIWNEQMNAMDRKIFYTNQEYIDFDQYLRNYVLGARKYCVREGPETIPHARKVLSRLYYLDVLKNLVFALFLVWLCTVIASNWFK